MAFKKELIEREGRSPIISLYGELDIYVSSDFKDEVLEILDKYKEDICLDFTNLEYIDSTGLGALISILKATKELGKNVNLKEVNERIRKLFKITDLEDMFVFVGGIDE